MGHSAFNCWHCSNLQYTPTSNTIQANVTSSPTAKWLLDSRASSQLSNDTSHLSTMQPYSGSEQITIGNGQSVPIQNVGRGLLPTPSCKLQLNQIIHAPNLSHNLLSVHKLTSGNNCYIVFDADGYILKDVKINQIITHGLNSNRVYPLCPPKPSSTKFNPSTHVASISSMSLWCQRLGHPSSTTLQLLCKVILTLASSNSFNLCTICQMAKASFTVF